jgi:uncharacterized protein (DUF362 family)
VLKLVDKRRSERRGCKTVHMGSTPISGTMKRVIEIDFVNWQESVGEILDKAGLGNLLKGQKKVILKPNLTLNSPPPCTTPTEMVEEVIKYVQKHSRAEIVVAEGSGGCDTLKSFKDLGYERLAKEYGVRLVDLNRAKRHEYENKKALALKKVRLPEIIMEGFFINLPVLKQHDWALLTAATKNLFGIYLNGNILLNKLSPHWWNKSELHYKYGVNKSIRDLNLYRPSDFVLVDATIGQVGNEVHGRAKDPPIGKLIAGVDNLEVDKYCAPLIGVDVDKVEYLK